MGNGYGKYIIGIISLILFILLGIKLFQVATKPRTSTPKTTSAITTKALTDYASTDAEVRVTLDGPVTGDETHHAIRITVSRDERTLDVIEGYRGLVIRTKSYDNDQAAYEAFLRALNGMGFARSQKALASDEYASCPMGTHYSYELQNTGDKTQDFRLCSVTCGVNLGTAGFRTGPNIRALFKSQIPADDYATLTQDVLAGITP